MPDKGTKKKLTRVGGGEASSASAGNATAPFVPTEKSTSKAITLRIIAAISWILAIGAEVVAILLLRRPPIEMVWLIVLIAVDLVFAIVGSLLWKKANRFDPASQKEQFRFFIQNQLGAIISVIAFLPLVILIFTNKDMSGKQKGLRRRDRRRRPAGRGRRGRGLRSAVPGTVRRADGAGGIADRRERRILDEIGHELSPVLGLLVHQHGTDE